MNKPAARKRISKLRELINDYRYHYHVLDESTMSEAAADSLKHELAQLETQYPDLITPDSPTQRVAGKPLAGFQPVAHTQRMLSLNDVFNEREVEAWIERIKKLAPGSELATADSFFMDIKMDGLALSLIYEDGLLMRGVTRGDGQVGEDVTANIRTINSIPLRLRVRGSTSHTPKTTQSKEVNLDKCARFDLSHNFSQGRTEIRGEMVMYKEDFTALNAERGAQGLPLFANPRNTAAGTIRQLDPGRVAQRKLYFRAYDLLLADPAEVPTNAQAYKTLHTLDFLTNTHPGLAKDTKGILDYVNTWQDKRTELPFNTDGIVVKVNNRALFNQLGVVGKAARGAIAYKYAAEQATTKIKDIFISIGRTGAATPVAILESVVIAGSTVQMATLHNEGEITRKDIRVGDTVIVHKAGDIIPEVVEPLTKLRGGSEKPFIMPKTCPECRTKLTKLKQDEAVWRCPNNSCPSRVQKRIEHYASKAAIDIEGLGEKNVIALLNAKLIQETPDIYSLSKDNLLNLERFADISAAKLVNAIQTKKEPSLARFLYGLGIRHVGVQTALDLARTYRGLETLQRATLEDLSQVEGVGEVVAEAIVAWFADPLNQRILKKFAARGVRPQIIEQIGGPLSGKKFAITGSLESMSREAAAEKIRAQGGDFQSSVGQDTNYLVVGVNVGASKLTKAAKLDTPQISESTLLKLIDNK